MSVIFIKNDIIIIIIIMYLYSAQYLHILQDSKHYLTHVCIDEFTDRSKHYLSTYSLAITNASTAALFT